MRAAKVYAIWRTRGGRALNNEAFLNAIGEKGYWVDDHVLDPPLTRAILSHAQNLYKEGQFRASQIGRGADQVERKDIRSDHIHWIQSWSQGQALPIYEQYLQSIQVLAREGLFLPIRHFESHFALYREGSFYQRHRDQHRDHPQRLLTLVFYLNTLDPGQGGELILYPLQGESVRIQAQAGRQVIFDSRLEHEVTPCSALRWSLATWLRSD